MIVEDERIVARDLAATLVDLGYAVAGMVGTGEEAVAKAKEVLPDLILMDIRLAGPIDGVEACSRIKSERDTPVIFLTSHSDRETLRRATVTAPLGYLVKPFNPVELRCAIEIALYRHEIDARLREREQWLATTLRSISDGVVATDAHEKVTFVNAVAEALTGWTQAEAIGHELDQILTLVNEAATAVENPVRLALRDKGSTAPQRDALVDRGGLVVPVDNSAAPILDDAGRLLGGVMVLRDASEQRRAEDEIRSLNAQLEKRVIERTQQLEAANKELEAFSYSVAHDLRAPLRGIDGFSQMLIEDHLANLGPEGLDHLQRIRTSAKRMGQLIDDLLRLARIARRDLHLATVNLSQMANEIIDELRASSPDREISVHIADGIQAEADGYLIRIVLENLLRNAWKYTSKTPLPVIEFGTVRQDGATVYFVRDNGAGFDMAYAARLFGAFQRLHSANDFEGTGIGLAIVQRIVNRHGGRIWAEAAVDRGATFYFVV